MAAPTALARTEQVFVPSQLAVARVLNIGHYVPVDELPGAEHVNRPWLSWIALAVLVSIVVGLYILKLTSNDGMGTLPATLVTVGYVVTLAVVTVVGVRRDRRKD